MDHSDYSKVYGGVRAYLEENDMTARGIVEDKRFNGVAAAIAETLGCTREAVGSALLTLKEEEWREMAIA